MPFNIEEFNKNFEEIFNQVPQHRRNNYKLLLQSFCENSCNVLTHCLMNMAPIVSEDLAVCKFMHTYFKLQMGEFDKLIKKLERSIHDGSNHEDHRQHYRMVNSHHRNQFFNSCLPYFVLLPQEIIMKVIDCVGDRPDVEVKDLTEARRVILNQFREDHQREAPNILYATAYYCVNDNGNCCCNLLFPELKS